MLSIIQDGKYFRIIGFAFGSKKVFASFLSEDVAKTNIDRYQDEFKNFAFRSKKLKEASENSLELLRKGESYFE